MLSPRTLGLWAALIAASALISYGLVRAQFPAALLLGPMIGAIAFGVGGSRLRVPPTPNAMAEDFGADPRLVAFMQYVRVAAVVFSASLAARFLMETPVPGAAAGAGEVTGPLSLLATLAVAVVGAGAALALRVPAGAQVGPMVLGSLLHATGLVRMALPVPLLELAYACIGVYVGLRFTRETLRLTFTALPGILAATFSVIALCAAWGFGLTLLLPIDLLTAVLATSPGGLDSVAIIAVGSKADVSFVLAVQTLRLFVVLLTGPLLAKWISRSVPEAAR